MKSLENSGRFGHRKLENIIFAGVALVALFAFGGCSSMSAGGEKDYTPPTAAQSNGVQQAEAAHTQKLMNDPSIPAAAKAMLAGNNGNPSVAPVGQRQVTAPATTGQ